MALYLHLLGAFARPEDAQSKDAVGWIHTLGPLKAVAKLQDGRVHLDFKHRNNAQREGLDEGQFLKRVGNRYEFGGELYATYVINAKRRYP
jgi:hypothetical protein